MTDFKPSYSKSKLSLIPKLKLKLKQKSKPKLIFFQKPNPTRCKQDKMNNLITLSKLEQVD
jgi:hypothetical protein